MEFDDIIKLINDLTSDLSDIKKRPPIKRKVDKDSTKGVIDISFDDKVDIPKEKFDGKPVIKDYKYWILKLDRHYKSQAMKVNQLNVASLKMYASLCDSLEEYLNKKYTTVARESSKLRREGVNYDIYYSIYLIAEAQVLNFYNPLSNKDPIKSYNFLKSHFGNELVKLIQKRVLELSKGLKDPDIKTREYFDLTDNNKVSMWWDPKGILREKYDFSKKEELAINQISKRNNVLWKNQYIIDILLDMYLATVKQIFNNKDLDGEKLLNIVSPYQSSKIILDSIFLISESNVRDKFAFLTNINTQKSIDVIKDFDNGKMYDFIENYQEDYLDNIDKEKISRAYDLYFKKNHNKTKDFIRYVETLSDSEKIKVLYEHENDENFKKILIELLKKDDEILALYFLYKKKINRGNHDKILFGVIKEENYDEFLRLINKNELTLDLIAKIKNLNKAKTKKIKVDNKKIDISRANLNKTVIMVNEFFEIDEDNDLFEKEENVEKCSRNTYNHILKDILSKGYIKKDQLSCLAKNDSMTLNTYLGKINESLYDYIGDQTLVIENDKVIIDDFYVDMIKEYVSGDQD